MKRSLFKWGALVGAGLVLLDALLLEIYFFEVKTFNIGRNNSSKKIKLLLLTDLHFKKTFWPFYTKLANKVNELQPDLILIAGDLVDQFGTAAPAEKFMSLLDHSIPKVGIMGNHDHKSAVGMDDFHKLYKNNNGFLLVNESKAFTVNENSLMITGLDDYIEGNENLNDAIKSVGREQNHILLIHSPKQQKKVRKKIKQINAVRSQNEQLNIQYIFAGHNHGGQVRFLSYAPIMPEKSGRFINGWYNKKPPYLYVSKGFGTSTLPIRFSCRSEVTVFNLYV